MVDVNRKHKTSAKASEKALGAYIGWIQLVTPERLTDYSYIILTGGQLPSLIPVVTMASASLIFVALAVMRFRREEF